MRLTLRRLANLAESGKFEVNELAEKREGLGSPHYSRVWDILDTLQKQLTYKAELEENYLANLAADSELVEVEA